MVLRNLGEMAVLFFFHAYIPTLLCIIVFQFAENVLIARVADKKFPFLVDSSVGKITSEQKYALKENVRSFFLYKISGTIISSTDNILISRIGIRWPLLQLCVHRGCDPNIPELYLLFDDSQHRQL